MTRSTSEPPPKERPLFNTIFGPVAAELQEVDEILLGELQCRQPIVEQLVHYTSQWRGKRLRPALVLLAGKACGEISRAHKVVAAVVEMIHIATLVHDDVLDEASLRRHFATLNARWGNETSVLFGDYLFTHAFHLASSLESTYACRVIGRATNVVCEGELRQVHERGNLHLGEAEYLEIIASKTAELCACSCRLGAHYAGATSEVEQALERYGRQLGVAFQIADDLLDYLGDEDRVGKSLGTDVELGKLTLPLIRLLHEAPPESTAQLRRLLAEPGNHKREALSEMLQAGDAIGYVYRRALEFAESACKELDCLAPSSAKAILADLTELVVSRRH